MPAALRLVAVEGLAEQPFLVAERRIEARGIDPHRLGQVGQRRALIALVPEYLQGLIERLVHVEGAGASHRHNFTLLLFYWSLYKSLDSSGPALHMCSDRYKCVMRSRGEAAVSF